MYWQHIWLIKWEVIVGDMIDHIGIYGARVAEGLSASNVGLVLRVKSVYKHRPGIHGPRVAQANLAS